MKKYSTAVQLNKSRQPPPPPPWPRRNTESRRNLLSDRGKLTRYCLRISSTVRFLITLTSLQLKARYTFIHLAKQNEERNRRGCCSLQDLQFIEVMCIVSKEKWNGKTSRFGGILLVPAALGEAHVLDFDMAGCTVNYRPLRLSNSRGWQPLTCSFQSSEDTSFNTVL